MATTGHPGQRHQLEIRSRPKGLRTMLACCYGVDEVLIVMILITHKPNILDALGKDWFDVKEGEASIFHAENGGYKLVARVPMDERPRIAAGAHQ